MFLKEGSDTLKRMSASIVMGQTTNSNATLSIFELPKETIEKLERESGFNNIELDSHERESS
jgi:hypothetical protein